jgi:branched-chain amino acid transport system substrate-binding protein
VAALSLLAGCSLRYDFTECETDADCERVEDGQFLQCVDNTCVEAAIECRTDDDCGTGQTCMANVCASDTPDAGPDTSMPPDMSMTDAGADTGDVDASTGCSANSECGENELCLDSVCTSVLSAECTRAVFPGGSLDDAVVVGSILPLSPPYTNIGPPIEQAIELGMADFNGQGGLPGGRRVVWVSCDDRGNTDLAQSAAQHLVDLGAPAIIGPLFSTAFIDVTTNVTVRNDVYTIAPTATAPSLTGLDDNGLAWRTIASDVYQGNAIVDRIAALGVTQATVFVKDDAYGLGLFNEIATPLNNAFGDTGEQIEFVQYQDPAKVGFDQNQITAEFAMKVAQAYANNPDAELVVFVGTSETLLLANAYLQYLGQNGVPPTNYPRLLFSHGSVPDLPDLVAGSGGSLLPLVEGTAPDIFDPDNFMQYTLRFNLQFNGQDPVTVSTLAYDATLVVLFGMSAVPRDEVITGGAIAQNMASLVDKENGTRISFGDSVQLFVSEARNTLSQGGTVDLKGVSGELDFDLATGDVRSNVLGWEVVDASGQYQLDAKRIYLLDAEPAETGTWMDLMP